MPAPTARSSFPNPDYYIAKTGWCIRMGDRSAEATEAATAASDPIADIPNRGYEPAREAAMAAFAKSWRREQKGSASQR
jgi:hypothetical protein